MISLIFALSFNLFASDLEIWTSSEGVRDAIKSVKSSFEQEYKTKVNVLVLNKDLTNQFKTAALSGKGPDIFVWAHDVVGELAESGLLEPITIPPALKKELHPIALKAFTYKGKTYGYPYAIEAVALICNKKLIPEVPTSLENLKKLAKSFPNSDGKNYGFLYDIQNFFFSFPILSAGEGYIFKDLNGSLDTNDIGIANQNFIEGTTYLKSLVEEKIIPSSIDRGIAITKMKKGELGCTIDGPWAIRELVESGLTLSVSPIPTLNSKIAHPFVGAQGFLIRRGIKNKMLAFEFIEKTILTPKGVTAIYRLDPRIPARTDVINQLKSESPFLKPFEVSATYGIPMPNIPQMGAVWTAMGPALNLVLTGKVSPQIALDHAKKQIQNSLSK